MTEKKDEVIISERLTAIPRKNHAGHWEFDCPVCECQVAITYLIPHSDCNNQHPVKRIYLDWRYWGFTDADPFERFNASGATPAHQHRREG